VMALNAIDEKPRSRESIAIVFRPATFRGQ
jgi:hypothetical protein